MYWGFKYNNILVNFDHPGGSTSWDYICYYSLVKFNSPDGSTYWGLRYYNILVDFDHPGGSTSWGYICYYTLVHRFTDEFEPKLNQP